MGLAVGLAPWGLMLVGVRRRMRHCFTLAQYDCLCYVSEIPQPLFIKGGNPRGIC